ncbi:AAA family ATPase [Mesorhizobium sp. WSM2239]|uniref:AAA family ATPase n=2 Tax=unclassified Mesorhizobium TaxID=325217 RepID=A0AAU8DBV2_9HYPH
MRVEDRVAEFRRNVAADLYAPGDILDLESTFEAVDSYREEAAALSAAAAKRLDAERLATTLLSHPRLYKVLLDILSISAAISLEDGRSLPAPNSPPRDHSSAVAAASILIELGLPALLDGVTDVRRLLLILQISADAARRRFRVDAKIKRRIETALNNSIAAINSEGTWSLSISDSGSLPYQVRRYSEYVVSVNGHPRVAVASTFQTASGGRQSRELQTVYPNLNSALKTSGMSLMLIADGLAMRTMPERVLRQLFLGVPHTMTLRQMILGGMEDALRELAPPPPPPDVNAADLRRLIVGMLNDGVSARVEGLPVPEDRGKQALAQYASQPGEELLSLSPDGRELAWARSKLVSSFRRLAVFFESNSAIESALELFGALLIREDRDLSAVTAELRDDLVLSTPFTVLAQRALPTANELQDLSKIALQLSPESKVGILLVQDLIGPTAERIIRDAQTFLPVTLVVIGMQQCAGIASARQSPREALRELLLQQTDLRKLSPFVVRGATPSRVFFGREEEEASLLSTLPTNSVALLGGRRIGKTSLLRHCQTRLQSADLRPFFGDCQTVRTWEDFGQMAQRAWEVKLPTQFRPQHLFSLIERLDDGSGRSIVLLLDEIDQLLQWDAQRSNDEVPEAFFRACRSISQQGLAQFVFSGERTIASRMSDASSPHWNFCKPLMLQQLSKGAADALITQPFEALGVALPEKEGFADAAWHVSDGHPELLQLLGDKVVSVVNQRERTSASVNAADIYTVSGEFEYAEQYLETYWGQATKLEKIISILLISQPLSNAELHAKLIDIDKVVEPPRLRLALYMLELYGVIQRTNDGFMMKAHWFKEALEFYGGPDAAILPYLSGDLQ